MSLSYPSICSAVCRRSPGRVHLKQLNSKGSHSEVRLGWDRLVLSLADSQHQRHHAATVEGGPQGDQFVDDAAEGPHVRLVVVCFTIQHLRLFDRPKSPIFRIWKIFRNKLAGFKSLPVNELVFLKIL